MISFISSLEIIKVTRLPKSKGRAPDPNIFFKTTASVADAAAVNPNGIKMLLANGLNTFRIKANPVFSNGPKSLPKTPSDCPIL